MGIASNWLPQLREACVAAGRAILAFRGHDADVREKLDGSPVSAADHAAARIVCDCLQRLDPAIRVICEEGARDAGDSSAFWLVDPLDGTREFLRGGELFTVNVALVRDGRPQLGVIHAPASGLCWWGAIGIGAFHGDVRIRTRACVDAPRLLLSPAEDPRAPGSWLHALLAAWPRLQVDRLPGALKFCRLAEGDADFYVRHVPSYAWDTAAGQAIVEAAGGVVYGAAGDALCYRGGDWRNGAFFAAGDARAAGNFAW